MMTWTTELVKNRKRKQKTKQEGWGRFRCKDGGSVSTCRAIWCSQLNLAHNKRFFRAACGTEFFRVERKEGHKVL